MIVSSYGIFWTYTDTDIYLKHLVQWTLELFRLFSVFIGVVTFFKSKCTYGVWIIQFVAKAQITDLIWKNYYLHSWADLKEINQIFPPNSRSIIKKEHPLLIVWCKQKYKKEMKVIEFTVLNVSLETLICPPPWKIRKLQAVACSIVFFLIIS